MPQNLIIRTWEALDPFVESFARDDSNRLNLLILIGNPGLGKSKIVRHELKGQSFCNIEGHATAFQLYCELFRYSDRPVIIDDVDSLLSQRSAVPLLKCLCQTDDSKTVQWNSSAKRLENMGIPTGFETTSNVCIIANEWETINKNIGAIQDRGILLFFEPLAETVHNRAGVWFKDKQIYNFIGEHLHLIKDPSFRDYVKAASFKANKMDWRKLLLALWNENEISKVWQLETDNKFPKVRDKVNEFVRRGGSRATYFRLKARLARKLVSDFETLETV